MVTITDKSVIQKLRALPKADKTMTTDELRKLCYDYMGLQISFMYTPNVDFSYVVRSQNLPVTKEAGQLYAGFPYVTVGSGSLYRLAEFYDEETGVVDVTYALEDPRLFGNACTGAASGAWSRVISSSKLGYTFELNKANNCIPVGPYTYPEDIKEFGNNQYDNMTCLHICENNGEQVMYQSYAQVHLADGMVNRGHVRMFASEPKVVYKEGTDEIDGEKSTVLYRDQGCFTTSECHKRVDENGVEYVIQGGLDVEVTFKQLYDKHYIPFTFKEFLGTETVHKAKVITDLPALQTSVEDICCATFRANYSISDIFFLVKDKDGNEVHRSVYRHYYFTDRELNMKEVAGAEALEKLEVKDGYTIEITCQLYNGDLLTAYTGKLLKEKAVDTLPYPKMEKLDVREESGAQRIEAKPVHKNRIVFYGHSAFTRWTDRWGHREMEDDLIGRDGNTTVLNHGFGTSCAEELLYYYPRLVRPYEPRALVLAAFGNDIGFGYTPEETMMLLSRVIEWAQVDFPGIKIYLCGVGVGLKTVGMPRWDAARARFDQLAKDFCEGRENCTFVDAVQSPLFYEKAEDVGDPTKVRKDIFVRDMTHFNQLGYDLYRDFFKEVLKDIL